MTRRKTLKGIRKPKHTVAEIIAELNSRVEKEDCEVLESVTAPADPTVGTPAPAGQPLANVSPKPHKASASVGLWWATGVEAAGPHKASRSERNCDPRCYKVLNTFTRETKSLKTYVIIDLAGLRQRKVTLRFSLASNKNAALWHDALQHFGYLCGLDEVILHGSQRNLNEMHGKLVDLRINPDEKLIKKLREVRRVIDVSRL